MSETENKMRADSFKAAVKGVKQGVDLILRVRRSFEFYLMFAQSTKVGSFPKALDAFVSTSLYAHLLVVINGLHILGYSDKKKSNESLPYIIDKLSGAKILSAEAAKQQSDTIERAHVVYERIEILRSKHFVHHDRKWTLARAFHHACLTDDNIHLLIRLYSANLALFSKRLSMPAIDDRKVAAAAREEAIRVLTALGSYESPEIARDSL